jgi:hypothetical protein
MHQQWTPAGMQGHWLFCPLSSFGILFAAHHCCPATPLQTAKGWLLLYSLHVSKQPVLPHSTSHWSGAEQLQALRSVDVYIKHPLRCEHSAPPSCLCCDSQSILVAYADGCLGSASWLGKVRRCCSLPHAGRKCFGLLAR